MHTTSFLYDTDSIVARSKLPAALQHVIHACELAHLTGVSKDAQDALDAAYDKLAAHYFVTEEIELADIGREV